VVGEEEGLIFLRPTKLSYTASTPVSIMDAPTLPVSSVTLRHSAFSAFDTASNSTYPH
jgi:hypothetical protein